MDETTYEIPEGAHVGDIPIPAGRMTAREIANHINESGETTVTVTSVAGRPALRVEGGRLASESAKKLFDHIKTLMHGAQDHKGASSEGQSDAMLTGPRRSRRPFVLGRARLWRDPDSPTSNAPTARRHHHTGCRWRSGKGDTPRGWCCHANCHVPGLLAEEDTDLPGYSPGTCFTAGELRGMGADVPADVPDFAWVPRQSVHLGTVQVETGDDPENITARVGVKLTEPFRWIEVNAEITPK